MDKLLDYVEVLIPFDTACIALLEDEDRLAVRLVRGRDIWLGLDQPFNLTLNGGANLLVEMPVLTQRSLLIPDPQKFPGWQTTPGIETLRSWLGVPLVTGHKAIGLCILGKETEDSFTQDHIQWAEAMLSQAAVAIQNAWLFEQVRAGREHLQSLSHRLVQVQENARRYIARELHDDEAFLKIARDRNIAVVTVESEEHPHIVEPTADFSYARLELTQADEPAGYPKAALKKWAKTGRDWEKSGDVFLYFISGAKERNPAAAMAMLDLLKA